MELPFGRLWIVVVYLVASSVLSSVLGFLVYRLSEAGRRSIRIKVLLAHVLGSAIVIANIFAAAQLMFISAHDLGLLMLLLVACAAFSVTFGAAVADRMTVAVEQLAAGARDVAGGNFLARVNVSTNDELADLAVSFNDMVEHVNEAAAKQRRSEEARRDLVVAVSHDLRTPLTAIRAMREALEDGVVDDPATVQRYHATMRTQIDQLSHLIDDLFELSQIDAGGLRVELHPANLGSVVGEVVESFAMQASTRSVDVSFASIGTGVVLLDTNRIARVLTNLLDNALRHSPDGSRISVVVKHLPTSVNVTVRDHGPGVDPGDLEHIFERFFRGEKSRSRAHGGAGLGLAIAREVVEAHHGSIHVVNIDPADGGGASFSITLPLVA
jgi:signal transduction histidine kinase